MSEKYYSLPSIGNESIPFQSFLQYPPIPADSPVSFSLNSLPTPFTPLPEEDKNPPDSSPMSDEETPIRMEQEDDDQLESEFHGRSYQDDSSESETSDSDRETSSSTIHPHVFRNNEVIDLTSSYQERTEHRKFRTKKTSSRKTGSNIPLDLTDEFGRKKKPRRDEIHFEDIVFKEKIGEGSFGEVYHGSLWGQEVAIKKLRIKGMEDNKMKDFKKEIKIMRTLRHPNIVEFLGVCVEKGKMCIVTEYLGNGSLEDLLERLEKRNKKMSLKRVLRMAKDIARGLNWLHHKSIIHRDLKTANILVDENGRGKIADFGLSHMKKRNVVKSNTVTLGGLYGVCGTPCYMAPEVINKQPYGEKADVFSFGIVLCELIMGKYPYENEPESTNTFEQAIVSGLRPTIPDEIHPQIRDLIIACWAELPTQRPSMDHVMKSLTEIEQRVLTPDDLKESLDELPEPVQQLFTDARARVSDLEHKLDDQRRQLSEAHRKIQETTAALEKEKKALERAQLELAKRESELAMRAVAPTKARGGKGGRGKTKVKATGRAKVGRQSPGGSNALATSTETKHRAGSGERTSHRIRTPKNLDHFLEDINSLVRRSARKPVPSSKYNDDEEKPAKRRQPKRQRREKAVPGLLRAEPTFTLDNTTTAPVATNTNSCCPSAQVNPPAHPAPLRTQRRPRAAAKKCTLCKKCCETPTMVVNPPPPPPLPSTIL